MSVIFFLIPLSILAAAGFLAAFIWAVRSGQYEDTCTPSMRILVEERPVINRVDRVRTAGAETLPSAHEPSSTKASQPYSEPVNGNATTT